VWKSVLIISAVFMINFILIMISVSGEEGAALLLLLFDLAIGISAVLFCIMFSDIKVGTEKIANGNTDAKINEFRMIGDLRYHAKNINSINDGIARAVEQKMKSERFKTELITNVSHDIKTPLTSIINYVDLLSKESIDNENAEEYIEVLTRQSSKLKKLIDDLLEASKASTGNLAVNFSKLEIGTLLSQTIGEYEERFSRNSLEIVLNPCSKMLYISADNRHMWRIFDNIFNNIAKYAQPNTRVYIDAYENGTSAEIIFKNVSKEKLNISGEELVERFVRGDSSRNTEGSGLGLSIARSLAELQNGRFDVQIDGDLFKVKLVFPIVNE
nr:sensor histidine kinase [Oscillospiraceae bacterium]